MGKLITRDTDYAVRALLFLAQRKKEIVSVSQLAKSVKAPQPFLRKILRNLNKKGLLKSYKGKSGGFALVLPPKEILLVDLIKIFQGPVKLNECILKKVVCPSKKTCKLKKKINAIEKYVIAELKAISIASLSI